MDLTTILPFFQDGNLLAFFIKSFAIIFGIMFVLYAIVIARQTDVMNRTVKTGVSSILTTISLLQLLFSVIVLGYALLFI